MKIPYWNPAEEERDSKALELEFEIGCWIFQ